MKLIRIILWSIILCLNVGITQIFALEAVNFDARFTQKDITKSINEVIEVLEHDYIYPEKSKLIISKLKYKLASNDFNQIDKLGAFVNELGVLIRNVSGDSYLDIMETNPFVVIGHTPVHAKQKDMENFGFEKVEILAGNIGYLKLNFFSQSVNAELRAAHAFDYLSGADAIIIDLRDVEGESISLAQYMMGFFVETNTTLANVVYDRQKQSQILKSPKKLGFEHFKQDYPVYILTSAFVSGTGEFFSYTLKNFKKAVIVGEKTMGVAVISKKQKVNEFISINIPIAFPVHPITNTNWEDEGVIPDVNIEANLSFDVSYKLAKEYLGIF
ncbi:S41 family peptidase [Colwellia piezophila]|uniref:S41 family peptidase n=1 Tax=Colwellia piezophila TaxID=211668 RepID=UPI0003803332|nr:S41 family peptidase [Colwellia piezophila]